MARARRGGLPGGDGRGPERGRRPDARGPRRAAPFGIAFAMNSAVHSYLILAYADDGKVAMNVGFYYTANAVGRLAGTILSGLLYQWHGLTACLWASTGFLVTAGLLSLLLPAGRTECGESCV
jgi:predicted MFS family arabinose efflux permease